LLNEAHCLGEQMASFCRQNGFQPSMRCRSAQLLTVQELVALGQGISLMPAMARKLDRSPRRVYRSLAAPRPTRTLAMIWHKHRFQSPLVQRFIEIIRCYVSVEHGAHKKAGDPIAGCAAKAARST
jgi:LysR family hydrogen peroxide-inducible transcriptional activator